MKSAETPSSGDNGVIKLVGERRSGAEHRVWLDKARGLVRKIPSRFGRIWQKMHPDFAERDLSIMRDMEVPLVPTEIRPQVEVSYLKRVRRFVGSVFSHETAASSPLGEDGKMVHEDASYVLEQPLFADSHSMTYADLLNNGRYLQELLDFARMGLEIRAKTGLGFDLLGGKTFKLIGPALNPRVKAMPAEVANLLVADRPIMAQRDWPGYNIKAGSVIAREGEVRQCDTRMYDLRGDKGIFFCDTFREKATRAILVKIQDLQDAVLWSVLRSLNKGIQDEFGLERTAVRRMAKKLVEHATPKMIAGAEMAG
ncbi:hypothetical protein JW752_04110 [Candidatus Peregrinibacteria bacterium]|nr:hypothetical protein [Candidatus Peregrinibacteria bacterium]